MSPRCIWLIYTRKSISKWPQQYEATFGSIHCQSIPLRPNPLVLRPSTFATKALLQNRKAHWVRKRGSGKLQNKIRISNFYFMDGKSLNLENFICGAILWQVPRLTWNQKQVVWWSCLCALCRIAWPRFLQGTWLPAPILNWLTKKGFFMITDLLLHLWMMCVASIQVTKRQNIQVTVATTHLKY